MQYLDGKMVRDPKVARAVAAAEAAQRAES
jgi:hypothetical protein